MVQPPWGQQEGWRQGGGGWRRWGAKGETFSSLRQAAAASLLRGVPPRAPRPPGVSQLLGVKGNKESRWSTPTPVDLRPEETWGGVTSLTAYTESEAVPGCQSLGSPIPCPSNERPRPGGARAAHRPLRRLRVSLTLRRERHRTQTHLSSPLISLLSYILTPPLVCCFIPHPPYFLRVAGGVFLFLVCQGNRSSASLFSLCVL